MQNELTKSYTKRISHIMVHHVFTATPNTETEQAMIYKD